MKLHPPISPKSVVGKRQLISKIPSRDAILMVYWVAVQVRTMRSSVMYKNKFRMVDMTLRRVLRILCGMFLRVHLRINRSIDLL